MIWRHNHQPAVRSANAIRHANRKPKLLRALFSLNFFSTGGSHSIGSFSFVSPPVLFSQIRRMGLATNMEEYVPTMIPTIRAKAKSWITPPPRKKRARTTIRVVEEVRIVRLRVSFMLIFMVCSKDRLRKRREFSRILSKTIIVSLREYPTIVKRAAIIEREISLSERAKTPMVMVTSWTMAIIAPKAYFKFKK